MELILRLKQICNFCPETGESTKLADLRARLESIVASGERALVFSQYADERFGARRIARELAAFAPVLFTGDLDPQMRTARLAECANDPRRHVLVLSLRAGGVGLNLTGASHVIHFDRRWNPAVESQAEDRAHRIGQERPVHVHSYLCGDSIEERVEEILQEKRMLSADVIDGVDTRMLGRLDLDTLLRRSGAVYRPDEIGNGPQAESRVPERALIRRPRSRPPWHSMSSRESEQAIATYTSILKTGRHARYRRSRLWLLLSGKPPLQRLSRSDLVRWRKFAVDRASRQGEF
jgi:hypothetical protein